MVITHFYFMPKHNNLFYRIQTDFTKPIIKMKIHLIRKICKIHTMKNHNNNNIISSINNKFMEMFKINNITKMMKFNSSNTIINNSNNSSIMMMDNNNIKIKRMKINIKSNLKKDTCMKVRRVNTLDQGRLAKGRRKMLNCSRIGLCFSNLKKKR